jgi:hypothetical protein
MFWRYNYIYNTVLSFKVKVKIKFALEQAMKAHRGSKGIALFLL